jgi:MraZ protein
MGKNKRKWVIVGNFNFIGNYSYTIDEKNRFNIPAKFRKQLDVDSNDTFILTIGLDSCIYAYPLSHWKTQLEQLQKLDLNRAENRQFVRAVAAYADEAHLDKQGRIVLPANLKSYAKLDKNIVVVGMFDKIEIWDEAAFASAMKSPMANIEAIAERVGRHE